MVKFLYNQTVEDYYILLQKTKVVFTKAILVLFLILS